MLSVALNEPWVKIVFTSSVITPKLKFPISFCTFLFPTTFCLFAINTSLKFCLVNTDDLKPLLLTFAMLLVTVSCSFCKVINPDTEVYKPLITFHQLLLLLPLPHFHKPFLIL